MSTYNTQLQSNNTDLQQVLQNLQSTSASIGNEVDTQADLISQIQSAVDNLPEAGSGGSGVEVCTISFYNFPAMLGGASSTVYYLDFINGEFVPTIKIVNTQITESADGIRLLQIVKNSLIVLWSDHVTHTISGNIVELVDDDAGVQSSGVFFVSGDCEIWSDF